MALEAGTYISDLVATNPTATDAKSQGDDHIRLLKSTVKTTFPNITGAVTVTQTDLNSIPNLAPKASPTFTGTPTAPTAALGDSSTQLATTAFVAGTALAATLPAQTGKADYVMTTDGGTPGTASWTNALKASVIRFKDGTDATKQLAFDVSGVTTGTTRTVTIPNKSGTLAMTSDLPTYALTLVAALTPTVAANLDALNVFSSTYDNYLIVIDGLLPSANDSLALRFANSGVVDAGSNYSGIGYAGSSVVGFSAALGLGSTVISAGKGITSHLNALNVNAASGTKACTVQTVCNDAATPSYYLVAGISAYIAAAAVSGFRLYWNGGSNFQATGKVRVYGYQNS